MSRPHISGRPIKSKGALNLWLTNHGYPPTYGGRSWSDYSQPDLRTLTQEAFPNEKVPQSKTKIYYINALVTADRLTDNRTARRLSLAQAAMHQPMEPLPQDPKQRRPTPSPVPEFFYPSSLSRAPRKARSTAVAESESDLVSSDDELPLQKRVRRSSPILESAIDSSDDMPIQKRVRRSSPIPESAIDSSDDMQIQKRVRRISPVASLSPGPEDLDESASEVDSVGHDQTMADSGDDSDSSASSLATLSMSQSRAQPNRQRPAQAPVRAKSSAPYDIPQQGTHRATLGARNGFEASAASAESTPRTLISHPESNRSDIKHQSIATWNCPTCFDDFEPNEVPALAVDARCQHASMTICGTCLQEYITAQSTSTRLDSIVCPIEACNATLSYNQMRMYATKEVFLRYDNEIARNALQGSEDYLECANVKCSHRGFVNPEMSFITCSCGTRTCVDCCTAWHPDQTHEENMAEIERAKEREREVAEQGSAKYLAAKTKACPSCGSHIIKSTGCDHMRCLARLRTKEGCKPRSPHILRRIPTNQQQIGLATMNSATYVLQATDSFRPRAITCTDKAVNTTGPTYQVFGEGEGEGDRSEAVEGEGEGAPVTAYPGM